MHLGEKLAALHERFGNRVPVWERIRLFGVIPFTRFRGWLSIESDGGLWVVTWTNRRNADGSPAHHDAIEADVMKNTGELNYIHGRNDDGWKTVLPPNRVSEAMLFFRHVRQRVDLAYAFHVTQPWMSKPDLIPNVRG